MAPVLHIRLLGDCYLCHDGAPDTGVPVTGINTPRLQSLLAYLLLHREAPQARSHVAFQFWPDSTEAQAHSNLRTLLHRLRRALPDADQFISVEGQTVQWQQDASYFLDVASFEQALTQAGLAGERAKEQPWLEQAIELYGGDLLPSCYDDWILPERERLHQAYIRAMEGLIQLLEAGREYDRAIRYAQRLLRHDPLQEVVYRRLMRLRALSGDRAGALRVYHTCATMLQRELGVEPSSATQRAYENLLQAKTQPAPVSPAAAGVSPLVGREEEWVQLKAAWRRSARGPRFALLLGEAGIGKTRLVEDLLQWAVQQGIECAYTRCYAAGGDLAYAPVMTLLRARPLPELDDVWLSEVARLLPEIRAGRPGLAPARPMTEPWQRQHLLEALARAALGDGQPLLLVIDDLQWCDQETLAWLHFLLRFNARARLLVVGTCRPEELDKDCHFAETLPNLHHDVRLTEIELGSLDEAETWSLASHVAGQQLGPGVAGALYRETEGNPLFVVEMVRAGAGTGGWEAGTGAETGQTGIPPSSPSHQALPPRVRAVLAARLDRLSPPARDLAGLAAAIGRAFTLPVLRSAREGDEDALVRGLDELWQRRIVRERGVDAYDFAHDKLREAAYGALSPARRGLLHRQVAHSLEAVHALDLDPVSGQIAVHYERAGLPQQAVPHYLQAGEAASRIYANAKAEASFRRGLALLEAGPEEGRQEGAREMAARLYEGLGQVLRFTGRHDEARTAFEDALERIEANNRLHRSRLLVAIGFTWWGQGQFDQALSSYAEAERVLGPEPAGPQSSWWRQWLDIQHGRLMVYYFMGLWQEMGELAARAQPAAERYGTPVLRAWLILALVGTAMRRDRYAIADETLALARAAEAACQEARNPFHIALSHLALGWCYLLRGEPLDAERDLQAMLALTERTGDVHNRVYALAWLTVVRRMRGQVDAVRDYAARTLEAATTAHMPEQVAVAQANQAWVAWREGNLAEAEELGQAAIRSWQCSQWAYAFQWTALWPLLVVALEKDRVPKALDHARVLLDPQQQRLPGELEAALEESIQVGDEGPPEKVRPCLQQAIDLAQVLGYL